MYSGSIGFQCFLTLVIHPQSLINRYTQVISEKKSKYNKKAKKYESNHKNDNVMID